jgi:DNA-binding MarR family transcriptional regulator
MIVALFSKDARQATFHAYTMVWMDFAEAARKMASECPAMRARQASRVLGKAFDEALRPLGIQVTQLPLLCGVALFGERGASISALAKGMVLDPTTLTRNIRPLERAGLLRVARSPVDARSKILFLTRSGERVIEASYPLWQQALKRVHAEFGTGRIEELRAQLANVVAVAGGFVGKRSSPR